MRIGDLRPGDRFRLVLASEAREGNIVAQHTGSTVVKYSASNPVQFETGDGRRVNFEGRTSPVAISPETDVEPIGGFPSELAIVDTPGWNRDGLRLPFPDPLEAH